MEWPAYAISHGLNPFHSTRMFFPGGVNILANTSQLLIGTTLTPITWAFGPVAALNVALTLSPAASAMAMFVLVRRWVRWLPAAFFAGLLYGFSPFVVTNLTQAHLNFAMVAIPPLVVACLDELLVSRRHRPVPVGIMLGLLLAIQFFVGTEVLLGTVLLAIAGVALVALHTVLKQPSTFRDRWRSVVKGLVSSAVTAGVVLIYPTWYALEGPSHFAGRVWAFLNLSAGGTSGSQFLIPQSAASVRAGQSFFAFGLPPSAGGYPGDILSPQYFGVGLFIVVIAGLVVWRHDLRIRLFAALALFSVVLSFGAPKGSIWPWQAVAGLPVFDNVLPSRFVLFTYLSVAVILGIVVDRGFAAMMTRKLDADGSRSELAWSRRRLRARALATLVASAAVAVSLLPPATYLAANMPISTESVVVPSCPYFGPPS
jgi:hypothetical protein